MQPERELPGDREKFHQGHVGPHPPNDPTLPLQAGAVPAGAVQVEEEPYAEFALWLDGRLKALEARFSHMITPRSRRQIRRRSSWR